jgi:predicted PurR-regulated permease PerM
VLRIVLAVVACAFVLYLTYRVRIVIRLLAMYARELRSNATFRHYDNRYKISAKLVQDARHLPERLGHLVGPLKQVTVQAFSFIGQLVTVLAITFLLLLHTAAITWKWVFRSPALAKSATGA